jgi:guanylate kinase
MNTVVRFGKSLSGVGDCPELLQAPGRVVLVSGPSGVGKGTLINGIFQDPEIRDQFAQVKSMKTRAPRPGELGSADSEFVDEATFLKHKNENKLFQWAFIDGNWYGSRISEILAKVKSGKNVFFELAAPDALALKAKYPQKVTTFFIAPPAPEFETLRARLVQRNTNSEESMAVRLANAVEELRLKDRFDHIIVNQTGQIPQAIAKLKTLVLQAIGRSTPTQPEPPKEGAKAA